MLHKIGRLSVGLSCLIALFVASQASAAISYTIRFSNAPTSMVSGQTATLNVVLEETVSAPDTFRLGSLDANNDLLGLVAANFRVSIIGTGGSSIQSVAGNAVDFDLQNPQPGNVVLQTILFNNPAIGSVSGNTRTIQLGTVDILASGTDGQTNTLVLSDQDPLGDDLIIDSFSGGLNSLILDPIVVFASSPAIQITAVPEPGSMALVGLAGVAAGLRYMRRRTK